MTDSQNVSAADLGRDIEAGRIDPRDLCERYLAAIADHPDCALIYARLTVARARLEAEAAAERAKSGTRLGPLDGVPISWKDNYDMAGIATEAGSRLLAGRVPAKDAVALTNATGQGTVTLGKTHLSELAFSGLGLNPMTATPPNVFDRRRVPGGSSSGAAVSTALDLAAGGMGSDTGGSSRVPAVWNGLVGFKPTVGAVSGEGVVPLSTTFDTPGPLAKSVEDAALLHYAMQGRVAPAPEAVMPSKLMLPETYVLDEMDPEVAEAFEGALGLLGKAGVAINRVETPEFPENAELLTGLGGRLMTDAWRDWGETIESQPTTMYPLVEARFRSGARFSAEDAAKAGAGQDRLRDQLVAKMADNGLMIMPTSPILPPLIGVLLTDEAAYTRLNLLALRNTRQVNLLGLCAITLPLVTPMTGLMLIGGPGQEEELLATAAALEPLLKAG